MIIWPGKDNWTPYRGGKTIALSSWKPMCVKPDGIVQQHRTGSIDSWRPYISTGKDALGIDTGCPMGANLRIAR